MTPKICVILGTDEDGNQKYVELTQQQAMAYNAGALPILQNTIGGQQQYILTDQVNISDISLNIKLSNPNVKFN
jgi:hypothetical protein